MKRDVRKELLKERDGIHPDKKYSCETAIRKRLFRLVDYKRAQSILFYASFRSEVETFESIKRAIKMKKRIALPRVEKGGLRLYYINDISELVPGYMGILEPDIKKNREVSLKDINLAIIPGAGFDVRGHRLGYGHGYYDKLLSTSGRHIVIVALAFEQQVIPGVPNESHDVRVDKIITEKRTIICKK